MLKVQVGFDPVFWHIISSMPDLAAEPQFDAGALATLEGMGFPAVRCKKALLATGNGSDAEAAMEWLFQHMEDPGGHCTYFLSPLHLIRN
jgi:uncharacterized UBP type Zn finger protein